MGALKKSKMRAGKYAGRPAYPDANRVRIGPRVRPVPQILFGAITPQEEAANEAYYVKRMLDVLGIKGEK